MKLSKTQLSVLRRMANGEVMTEMLVALSPFRGLGAAVAAERRYFLNVRPVRVRYETFKTLFKYNLIRPHDGEHNHYPIRLFVLTEAGVKRADQPLAGKRAS